MSNALRYDAVEVHARLVDEFRWVDYSDDGEWEIVYPDRACQSCTRGDHAAVRDGYLLCPECAGEPWEACKACGESGEVEGEGGEVVNCRACGGDGEIMCAICGGDGEVECPECLGMGGVEGADDGDWCVPMMLYVWPLEGDKYGEDDADKLDGLCITLLRNVREDACYLALTGGGMDLSWDIATAYVRLGLIPPATLRLPRFSGMGWSEERRRVVEACRNAQEALISRANFSLGHFDALAEWLDTHGRG